MTRPDGLFEGRLPLKSANRFAIIPDVTVVRYGLSSRDLYCYNQIESSVPVFWVLPRTTVTSVQATRIRELCFMGIERLFENDRMCAKCARWYLPPAFEDDGFCASCKRREKQASNRLNSAAVRFRDALLAKPLYEDIDPESLVYFIIGVETRRLKVGYTSQSVYKRLKGLQGQSPDILRLIGVVNAPQVFEREMHKVLKPFHSHGEWFEVPADVLRMIRQNTFLPSKAKEDLIFDFQDIDD
jgi:hypothetical protein